ncbi:hypothetical protein WMY93_024110 [Mugilogobius chulae]|uniref:Periphilin-1 C-terminal domain-containing protein n=1 Tax=Mugilogobius chulae TaxID=88201 RepID=A0AAW0NBX4_9GOBI
MGGDFDRRVDGPMYSEHMPYQDPRECQGNNNYPHNNMPFFENENHRFGNFHRNPPPPRNEGHFIHNRDDLRHHLDSRNNGRGGHFFRNRGRDLEPHPRDDVDYRRREPCTSRDRSPVRRKNHSSSSASRSFEKNPTKPTASVSPPHENSKQDPPQTVSTSKDDLDVNLSPLAFQGSPPASIAELEEEEAASVEPEPTPKPTPEQELKARRSEAIKAKALEIEKDYRQDCETFRTVVKMLVDKEPSLDYLLQAPLEKNLEQLKGRCLDSLKQFIKELDEAIDQPSQTDQPTEDKT